MSRLPSPLGHTWVKCGGGWEGFEPSLLNFGSARFIH